MDDIKYKSRFSFLKGFNCLLEKKLKIFQHLYPTNNVDDNFYFPHQNYRGGCWYCNIGFHYFTNLKLTSNLPGLRKQNQSSNLS